jgi:hypothetical protein
MPAPVLWLKTDKPYEGQFRRARVWNAQQQAWETPVYEKGHPKAGRPMVERIPGVGYEGEPSRAVPMKRRRFVEYLRTDGHVVAVPITNAAAHVPDGDVSCETDRRLKAKYYAWIEVGKCPCSMLLANELPREVFRANTSKWTAPCNPADLGAKAPPCPHFLEEMTARRSQRRDETAEIEKKFATETEKHMAAIEKLAGTVTTAVTSMQAAAAKAGGK